MKKNCLISAVGKGSLHKSWIDGCTNSYDVHLIFYDDSYKNFIPDSPFVVVDDKKGQKFGLIYRYLTKNPDILKRYDYFYCPDDDIFIDDINILGLFKAMEEFNLAIAQPALLSSYYTFPVTLKRQNSILRFTNFVEIMQPCFSREALSKVLFTFNENESNWGIDFHWGIIIGYEKRNMAIIDFLISVHTRPVGHSQPRDLYTIELDDYKKKYKLSEDIIEIAQIVDTNSV